MLDELERDKPHEECAVFGIFGHKDAVPLTILGLHALQHRGQEACGIISSNGNHFQMKKAIGLVGDNFNKPAIIDQLAGYCAIGHNRYSTTGASDYKNIQPLYADFDFGGAAIAHNGNLVNGLQLRGDLVDNGRIFSSTTDTEVILQLIAMVKGHITDRLKYALSRVKGAFALLCMTKDCLIGVRDSLGIRPLMLGKFNGKYVLSSESVGFDIIGAKFERMVEPGEMVVITESGLQSIQITPKRRARTCLFEYVYFARPDGIIDGINIYQARKQMGRQLAMESRVSADVVVPIPDSGTPSALGFAEESGIGFDLGIIRNHYVGRTFIEPTAAIRHLGVKLKHNANRSVLRNKRVVLVDDSLVRGTTASKIVKMVRDIGAKEVHFRLASPQVLFPDFYGIDMPTKQELLANNYSMKEMIDFLGVDSLEFLSLDGLYRALGEKDGRDKQNPQFTDHYFSGDYPISVVGHDAPKDELSYMQVVA